MIQTRSSQRHHPRRVPPLLRRKPGRSFIPGGGVPVPCVLLLCQPGGKYAPMPFSASMLISARRVDIEITVIRLQSLISNVIHTRSSRTQQSLEVVRFEGTPHNGHQTQTLGTKREFIVLRDTLTFSRKMEGRIENLDPYPILYPREPPILV